MSDDWLYGRSPGGRQDEDSGDPDATRPVPREGRRPQEPREPAAPREPGPDETRVMPTVSREHGSAPAGAQPGTGPGSTAARAPRETPAPPPPGASGRTVGGGFLDGVRRAFGRVGRPRFKLRYLWILVALWLVYLIAVPFFAWSKVDKIDAFHDSKFEPAFDALEQADVEYKKAMAMVEMMDDAPLKAKLRKIAESIAGAKKAVKRG